MKRPTMLAAMAGALVALAVVAGFMALDRTVGHWYVDSPAERLALLEAGNDQISERVDEIGQEMEVLDLIHEPPTTLYGGNQVVVDLRVARLLAYLYVKRNLVSDATMNHPQVEKCLTWIMGAQLDAADEPGSSADCGLVATEDP